MKKTYAKARDVPGIRIRFTEYASISGVLDVNSFSPISLIPSSLIPSSMISFKNVADHFMTFEKKGNKKNRLDLSDLMRGYSCINRTV